MKTLTFPILLLLSAGYAQAQSIPQIWSTAAHGDTLTITGTGFGIKNPAKPLFWATFDSGPTPEIVADGTTFSIDHDTGWRSDEGVNNSGCIKATALASSWSCTLTGPVFNDYSLKFYLFRKQKRNWNFLDDSIATGSHTFKSIRSTMANDPGYGYLVQSNNIYTGNHSADNGGFVPAGSMPGCDVMYGDIACLVGDEYINRYVTDEIYYINNSISTSGVGTQGDGAIKMIRNGDVCVDVPYETYNGWRRFKSRDVMNDANGWNYTQMAILYMHHTNDNLPDSSRVWFDEAYADTTWARVILGNANTLAASTHREIQIPIAWNNTEISVSVNLGSFSSAAATHLFVVNSTGTASLGYALGGENLAPILAAIDAQSVPEGETLVVGISATDPDGDSLVLSAIDLPINATLSDNGNGTGSLSFSPTFNQAGVYNVTVVATDGTLADSEILEIVVTDVGEGPPGAPSTPMWGEI